MSKPEKIESIKTALLEKKFEKLNQVVPQKANEPPKLEKKITPEMKQQKLKPIAKTFEVEKFKDKIERSIREEEKKHPIEPKIEKPIKVPEKKSTQFLHVTQTEKQKITPLSREDEVMEKIKPEEKTEEIKIKIEPKAIQKVEKKTKLEKVTEKKKPMHPEIGFPEIEKKPILEIKKPKTTESVKIDPEEESPLKKLFEEKKRKIKQLEEEEKRIAEEENQGE